MEDAILKTAEALRATGHPNRVEILILLGRKHKLSVKEIHETLGLSQPETSRHLTILKNASVLVCEKKDGNSYYSINKELDYIAGITRYLLKKT